MHVTFVPGVIFITLASMCLDLFIFFLLLGINLGVGLRFIGRAMILQHYAIGTKELTTAAIVAAILTVIPGEIFFYGQFNLYALLILTGNAIGYLIIANLLSNRLQSFLNCYSIAEAMGKLYGKKIRKVVAISGLLVSIIRVSAYLKVLSRVIAWFFNIKIHYALLIAFFLITLSVGSSGIQMLSLMSIIRYVTFCIVLPTIAWILWEQLTLQYQENQFRIIMVLRETWHTLMTIRASPWCYLSFFIFCVIPTFYSSSFQRILICRNSVQIKHAFNYAGFILLIINVFVLWITLLSYSTHNHKALSDAPLVPLYIFNDLWLKGLIVIGIVMLLISAGAAHLHSAAVLIANDIQNISKKGRNTAIRFTFYIFALAIISVLGTMHVKHLLQMIFITHILSKYIVSIPLLIALAGIHLHPYSILISIAVTIVSVVSWIVVTDDWMIYSLLPSICINLCSLILAQLWLQRHKQQTTFSHSAFPTIDSCRAYAITLWKRISAYTIHKVNALNFLDYCQQQLPNSDIYYFLFSGYIIVTGYCSFYTFSSNATWLETAVLFPSLFVASFFFIFQSIPPTSFTPYIRKIVAIMWPLSNFYFLFLVGSAMLIISRFSHLQAIIFVLNAYLSLLYTSLVTVLVKFLISIAIIWIVLPYFHSYIPLINICSNINISIVYIILIIFILGGSFLHHRWRLSKLYFTIQALRSAQEDQNARQFFSKQQVAALSYESSYIVLQLHKQLMRLIRSKQVDRCDGLKTLIQYIRNNSESSALIAQYQSLEEKTSIVAATMEQTARIQRYLETVFNHLKYNLYLTTNWIAIDRLLEECIEAINIDDIYKLPYIAIHTEYLYIQCDVERIKRMIINCLNEIFLSSSSKRDIFIYVNDTQLGYRLTLLQGKSQRVPAIAFTITTTTQKPIVLPIYRVVEMEDVQMTHQDNNNIDADNRHIVHAHYGYGEISYTDRTITHLYVIPVDVQEITKVFATLSPVVHTQHATLDPLTRKEESVFLERVHSKAHLPIEDIIEALQLIKTYYATQKRKTGELFYLHPMAVASILLDITEDANVIIAGLVHDVVQNTPLTEAGLLTLVGEDIVRIVWLATCIDKALPLDTADYPIYIEQLIKGNHRSSIMVKLADTLDNARTIHGHGIEKQIEKAKLVKRFYMPLAQKMGLTDIANELYIRATKVLQVILT